MSRLPRETRSPSFVLAVDRERIAAGGASPASWSLRDAPENAMRDAAVAARGRGWVDVIAANDLALHWLQTPPKSVASMAELHLVAQARCSQLYGTAPGGWRIAADWRVDRPFVCAALPCDVVDAVEGPLADCGMTARWHSAWSLLTIGMASTFPNDGWSAVRTTKRVVLWHCSGGEVDALAGWPASPDESPDLAEQHARRQLALENVRSADLPAGDLRWVDLMTPEGPGWMSEASLALKVHALAGGRR